jgi:hypothetical protein
MELGNFAELGCKKFVEFAVSAYESAGDCIPVNIATRTLSYRQVAGAIMTPPAARDADNRSL